MMPAEETLFRNVDDFLDDIEISHASGMGLQGKNYGHFSLVGEKCPRVVYSKNITKGKFYRCEFSKVTFIYLAGTGAEFRNCTFRGCRFQTCILNSAKFYNCRFEDCRFIRSRFELADIKRTEFSMCVGEKVEFRNSLVIDSKFLDGEWEASFKNATLSWSKFSWVCLDGSGFYNAQIDGTRFDNCDLTDVPLHRAEQKGAGALINDNCAVYPWLSGLPIPRRDAWGERPAASPWSPATSNVSGGHRTRLSIKEQVAERRALRKATIYSNQLEEFIKQ